MIKTVNPYIYLLCYTGGPFYLRLNLFSDDIRKKFFFKEPKICGWYVRVKKDYVMIYRVSDTLLFRVSEKKYTLNENVFSKFIKDGKQNYFEFWHDNKLIYKHVYKSPAKKWLNKSDINFDLSQEDMFFSIHKIIQNPQSWKDCFSLCK